MILASPFIDAIQGVGLGGVIRINFECLGFQSKILFTTVQHLAEYPLAHSE